jgi:hypothetical protein
MKTIIFRLLIALLILPAFLNCSSNSDDDPITTECPDGYQGSNCTDEITPTRIKIHKIVITSFPPATIDETGWDLSFGNPDIYIILDGPDGETVNSLSWGVFENADSTLDYTYEFDNTYIEGVNSIHSIVLYDDDGLLGGELMAQQFFTPYTSGQDFPTILTITNSNSFFQAKLYVTYEW